MKQQNQQWRLSAILLFVLVVLTRAAEDDRFVTRDGVHFMMNGSPFYGNGFNAYWLMYVASDPSQRDKISTAFLQAKSHDLSVGRTWAFSDGGYSPLQYFPGSYNEQMFKLSSPNSHSVRVTPNVKDSAGYLTNISVWVTGLDFVVSEAGKHGIKLILSLVNNYKDFGGKSQYVEWARNQGQNCSSEDDFYTNAVVKGYYKNHIKAVLTRNNTFTGLAYKDDPTIMAWELMNEPRCQSDLTGNTMQAWIAEMASFLKSIDNKHLLEIGLEGFYGQADAKKQQFNPNFQLGTDFIANNQIPQIDFATVHSYPDQWLIGQSDEAQLSFLKTWLRNHIQDSQNILQKPIFLAEFGKTTKDPGYNVGARNQLMSAVYSAIYASARGGGAAAGGFFWQLLTEDMDSLRDGYEIVFSESPSTADVITRQSKQLTRIRKMFARLKNLEKWKREKDNNNGSRPPARN